MPRRTREELKAHREYLKWMDEQYQLRGEKIRAATEQEIQEKNNNPRIIAGLLMPGEYLPGCDAPNAQVARAAAGKWLTALGLPVIENERLIDLERRIFTEWFRLRGPALNAETLELVPDIFNLPDEMPSFESCWCPILEPTEV